jgi:hypothetical protein
MTAGRALRAALADGYRQSWRLALVNATLGAGIVGAAYAALFLPAAGALMLVLLGPLAAALAHCAVTVAETEELTLADAREGLRLHWRRGLVLGTAGVATLVVAVVAVRFYAAREAWPLAVLAAYLAAVAALLQLLLWPLAVARRDRPLGRLVREALAHVLRRPLAAFGLGAALLLVNAAGVAAAVLPFLTLTLAYSFLAAAHFALDNDVLEREVSVG